MFVEEIVVGIEYQFDTFNTRVTRDRTIFINLTNGQKIFGLSVYQYVLGLAMHDFFCLLKITSSQSEWSTGSYVIINNSERVNKYVQIVLCENVNLTTLKEQKKAKRMYSSSCITRAVHHLYNNNNNKMEKKRKMRFLFAIEIGSLKWKLPSGFPTISSSVIIILIQTLIYNDLINSLFGSTE